MRDSKKFFAPHDSAAIILPSSIQSIRDMHKFASVLDDSPDYFVVEVVDRHAGVDDERLGVDAR